MRISIDHITHYTYEAPVRYSTQYLRLSPQSGAHQRVIDWSLETPGTPIELRDGYGNTLHVLTLDDPVTEIVIRARGVVETSATADKRATEPRLSPLLFLRPTPLTRAEGGMLEFAERFRDRAGTVPGLRDLAAAVLDKLPFLPGVTEVHSTATEAFDAGNGVCQDHAHVFIGCCRHLGVPARYVSGYLYSVGHAESVVASHAWAEAWVGNRWHSFDITNSRAQGEHHIRLAIGADYLDASPVRGVRHGGGEETMVTHALVGLDQ
ncbi:MAG TPA: transglutaminase family protein [Burkholderiales bacterium]|nr:transglutaminase family protein [Burkholderiales bacterium]